MLLVPASPRRPGLLFRGGMGVLLLAALWLPQTSARAQSKQRPKATLQEQATPVGLFVLTNSVAVPIVGAAWGEQPPAVGQYATWTGTPTGPLALSVAAQVDMASAPIQNIVLIMASDPDKPNTGTCTIALDMIGEYKLNPSRLTYSAAFIDDADKKAPSVFLTRFTPRLSSAKVLEKVEVRGWDPVKKEEIVGKFTCPKDG